MAYKEVMCSNDCCCGLSPFVNASYENNKLLLIRGNGELVDLEIAANAVSSLSKDPSVLLDLINQALKKQSDITKIADGTTITADGNGKLTINPGGLAPKLADGTTIKANNGKLSVDTSGVISQIKNSSHRLVNSTGEVVLGHILT